MLFSKKKSGSDIDLEQHELLENAQKRIKQKKRLFSHFVIFLIGSVFLILINKILKYGENYDWFIWANTLKACKTNKNVRKPLRTNVTPSPLYIF